MADGALTILVVEDSPDAMETAHRLIELYLPDSRVVEAGSAKEAIEQLESEDVDLAICDLVIPAGPTTLAKSEEHGFAVVEYLREKRSGVPVIILSAFANYDNTIRRTTAAPTHSALGLQLPMLQVARKGKPDEIDVLLTAIADGLRKLSDVQLESDAGLPARVERAVRQRALDSGYFRARVVSAGGLSSAQTAMVEYTGDSRPSTRTFIKLDDEGWIRGEHDRYRKYVAGVLQVGSYAQTELVQAGLGRQFAIEAALAADYNTLFQLLSRSPEEAVDAVREVAALLGLWTLTDVSTIRVGDLRRKHLSDETAASLGLDLSEFRSFETTELAIRQSICHGDLHGDNILVALGKQPLLVDFAYTGQECSVSDPVTLEMSLLFHPSSPARQDKSSAWMSGAYLSGSPYENFAGECRKWARGLGDESEIAAFSYAHAMRHAKHGNPQFALSVARDACRFFD